MGQKKLQPKILNFRKKDSRTGILLPEFQLILPKRVILIARVALRVLQLKQGSWALSIDVCEKIVKKMTKNDFEAP